jgi:hypothetical protein
MNIGAGMQLSASIYCEFAVSIWTLVHLGESMAILFSSWVKIDGLTVT